MTYCLGILVDEGLVLASDSRSNAGVDQVAQVSKLAVMPVTGDRLITVQSAGNLATTQAVVTSLREVIGAGSKRDLQAAGSMFEVAGIIGSQLREVVSGNARFVRPYGEPGASFLVAGQIEGEPPRLFQIYSAGNFVEASKRSFFQQIGETKYGKPILDRALSVETSLEEAAKLALLSFDATVRSNLSVGLPIDLLMYRKGSFSSENLVTLDDGHPYWSKLRKAYGEGLTALVASLPQPPKSWG